MGRELKPGDRVRLTTRDFEPDHRRDDTDIVESGPHRIPGGGFFYVVRMEKPTGPGEVGIILREDDIEFDAATAGEDEEEPTRNDLLVHLGRTGDNPAGRS